MGGGGGVLIRRQFPCYNHNILQSHSILPLINVLLDTDFDLLSEITHIETIARGSSVRLRSYLNKAYGYGNWRKVKGEAWIRIKSTGEMQYAELHWFEAHGIGQRDMKRKWPIKYE